MNTGLVLIFRNPLSKLLIKLGLTETILDFYWGRNQKQKWQEIEDTGYIQKPKSIWFEPTMRCNLNCSFCHQNRRRKVSREELNLSQIQKFLNAVKEWGIERVEMIGGEIFLRKDIFQILDLMEEKGIKVKLGSNGLLQESELEKLKRYRCIQSIAISIDGPPEIHNRLRNSPLAYQRAVTSLKKISGGRFLTVVYSLLLPQDFWRIEFLLNLAKELRVDRLTFMPEMFYSSQEVALSLEHLNLSYPEDIFVEVKEEKLDQQEMVRTIEILRRLRRKKGIFAPIFPRACYKYPREFFSGRIDEKKKLICRHFHSFTVIENGDILLCPFIYRKVGNIKEDSLQEAWNSQVMREMRMKILKNNLLPICRRCCSLDYL